MYDVTGLVSEDLELDVPRIDQAPFDIQRIVPESRFHLRFGHGELFAQDVFVRTDADTPAASAGRGFDHHRIVDLASESDGLLDRTHPTGARGNDGHSGFADDSLGLDLVAGQIQILRRRAYEDQAGIFTGTSKVAVLG
jgi:hypothetical protein